MGEPVSSQAVGPLLEESLKQCEWESRVQYLDRVQFLQWFVTNKLQEEQVDELSKSLKEIEDSLTDKVSVPLPNFQHLNLTKASIERIAAIGSVYHNIKYLKCSYDPETNDLVTEYTPKIDNSTYTGEEVKYQIKSHTKGGYQQHQGGYQFDPKQRWQQGGYRNSYNSHNSGGPPERFSQQGNNNRPYHYSQANAPLIELSRDRPPQSGRNVHDYSAPRNMVNLGNSIDSEFNRGIYDAKSSERHKRRTHGEGPDYIRPGPRHPNAGGWNPFDKLAHTKTQSYPEQNTQSGRPAFRDPYESASPTGQRPPPPQRRSEPPIPMAARHYSSQ